MARTALFPLLLAIAGCAGGGSPSVPPPTSARGGDLDRLALLWRDRVSQSRPSDFAIGPGDVLVVSVPGLPELEERTARVSGDGTITLPLIGSLRVEGWTEQELLDEIRARLQATVMHHPPVFLFVEEYRSRLVGVIGAVQKPGFYSIASESDTILDMIALAGGLTKEAAPRVQLIPASSLGGQTPSGAPALPGVAAAAVEPRRGDAIEIDLVSFVDGTGTTYLNLPVRPGDVILVPERGEVYVEGWVHRPGEKPISPGLGVLGAVAAAGGPQFPAKRGSVKLIRPTDDGGKVVYKADLARIGRGEAPDIRVQPGDVIQVPASVVKAIPWGVWRLLAAVFNVGKSID